MDMTTQQQEIEDKRTFSAERFHRTLRSGVIKKFLWLLMLAMLSSCSSIVKIDETWKAPGDTSQPYQKVLVAGISSNPTLRHSFENIFAETLKEHGVAAVASHTLISDLSKADEAHFQRIANQVGADAVLITRVLSHSENTQYTLSTGHLEYRMVAETKTTADSSTTIAMSGVGYVPGEMDEEGATLQTNLFDATSAKRVWTAMSRAAGEDNAQVEVCWKLSALLTQALGKDRLIEINSKEFKIPSL